MNYTKEKFHHTISVLVSAYMNDTLVHGNCYACAVGNLVADGLNCGFIKAGSHPRSLSWDNGMLYPGQEREIEKSGWGAIFTTDRHESIFSTGSRKVQKVDSRYLQSSLAMKQIESTGYHWTDLAKIEYAFESIDKRRKDKMFLGLMAVVEVLCEIHGMNETEKLEAKAMFVKA